MSELQTLTMTNHYWVSIRILELWIVLGPDYPILYKVSAQMKHT